MPPLALDPAIAALLGDGSLPPLPDTAALSAAIDAGLRSGSAAEQPTPDVHRTDHRIPTPDGALLGRWYRHQGHQPGSAVLYFHGGGMIAGSVELYDTHVAQYVQLTGVPLLSVDYRLAPEHPAPAQLHDARVALDWLLEHAPELGVDPGRLAVMGDSAGGGLAAACAIDARDRGIPLARQILVYPMLDDRTAEVPGLEGLATWTPQHNALAWRAVLNGATASALSAPARLGDFRGLAPAYLDVGELDLFRDEGIRYALGLLAAGVSAELHVRPGAPHGFDAARDAPVVQASWRDRLAAIRSL